MVPKILESKNKNPNHYHVDIMKMTDDKVDDKLLETTTFQHVM
jgi:hypothetical protein